MITFDIHSNHETVNDAIYQLDQAIKLARKSKERLICLITGYGSKKTSHKIKTNIEEILMEYKSNNKIKDFILGAT